MFNTLKISLLTLFVLKIFVVSNAQNTVWEIGDSLPFPRNDIFQNIVIEYDLDRWWVTKEQQTEIFTRPKNYKENGYISNSHFFKADYKIAVFLPALEDSCEYADELITSIRIAFGEEFAFFESYCKNVRLYNGNIQVLICPYFPLDSNLHQPSFYRSCVGEGMGFLQHLGKEMYQLFNIPKPTSKNDNAVVFVLDKNDKLIYSDYFFRAQAKNLFKIQKSITDFFSCQVMSADDSIHLTSKKIGEEAADFSFGYYDSLSSYRGHKMKLAFFTYPFCVPLTRAQHPKIMEITENLYFHPFKRLTSGIHPHQEIVDMFRFKQSTFADTETVHIVILNCAPEFFYFWKEIQNFGNCIFVNDQDFAISQKYNCYNKEGYIEQATYLIDEKGIITDIKFE